MRETRLVLKKPDGEEVTLKQTPGPQAELPRTIEEFVQTHTEYDLDILYDVPMSAEDCWASLSRNDKLLLWKMLRFGSALPKSGVGCACPGQYVLAQ